MCFYSQTTTRGIDFCSVALDFTKHSIFIRCPGPVFPRGQTRGLQNASVVHFSFLPNTNNNFHKNEKCTPLTKYAPWPPSGTHFHPPIITFT